MAETTKRSESRARGGVARLGFSAPLKLNSCGEELETTLLDWSRNGARAVLAELWEADVERLCGQRWKPRPRSKVTRAGWCRSDIMLGRERINVRRPRVRSVQGREIELPTFKAAARRDLLDRGALEDVTAAITMGSFPIERRTRERIPATFIERLATRLAAEHAAPKGEFDTGLLISAIDFPDQSFLGAVGLDRTGRRRLVGLHAGSAESEENATGLIDELVARHSQRGAPGVFLLGEQPALHAAVEQRFGRSAIVQRCAMEKRRRVLGLLPPSLQPSVLEALLDAYATPDVRAARRALQRVVRVLESERAEAAALLREGLEDTLTLHKLGFVAAAEPRRPRARSEVPPAPEA